MNNSLKFKSELKFNFNSIPTCLSALVVVSRILVQFSLQGKYCNCSTMLMSTGIFSGYVILQIEETEWLKEGSLTSGICFFFLRITSTRSSGIFAQLPADPRVHVIRPNLVVLASTHTNNSVQQWGLSSSSFPLPLPLSLAASLSYTGDTTVGDNKDEIIALQGVTRKLAALCWALWSLFPGRRSDVISLCAHAQRHQHQEMVLASRSGRRADKAQRRGAIETQTSSPDFTFLALLYLLTSVTRAYKMSLARRGVLTLEMSVLGILCEST